MNLPTFPPIPRVVTLHRTRTICEHIAFVGAACDIASFWRAFEVVGPAGRIGALVGCLATYLCHMEEAQRRNVLADHIDAVTGADAPNVPTSYRKHL